MNFSVSEGPVIPAAECVEAGSSPAPLLMVTEREGTEGDDARLRAADAADEAADDTAVDAAEEGA